LTVELMRDALRDDGWWLLVEGSEQSYVDTGDPLHLEFEYVQMIALILDACFSTDAPIAALHLGGGLCTVPRWLAARHPGVRGSELLSIRRRSRCFPRRSERSPAPRS
jgi:hypothetical protein